MRLELVAYASGYPRLCRPCVLYDQVPSIQLDRIKDCSQVTSICQLEATNLQLQEWLRFVTDLCLQVYLPVQTTVLGQLPDQTFQEPSYPTATQSA